MADPTVDDLLKQLSDGSVIVTVLKGSVFELILSEVRGLRTDMQQLQQQQQQQHKEMRMSIQTLSDHIDQLIQTAVSGVRSAVDQAKVATTQSAGTPAGQPDPAIDELDKKVTDALKTLQDTFASVTGSTASSGASSQSTGASSGSAGSPPPVPDPTHFPASSDASNPSDQTAPEADMGEGTAPKLPGQ